MSRDCDECDGTVELKRDARRAWFECPDCGAKYHAVPPQGRLARGSRIDDDIF